jgi:hypothetical protein
MEERKLTREEIALQILCAGISASSGSTQYSLDTYIPDPTDELGGKTGIKATRRAFAMADYFIKERDKA